LASLFALYDCLIHSLIAVEKVLIIIIIFSLFHTHYPSIRYGMDGEAETPVLISNAEVMELLQENLASRATKQSGSGSGGSGSSYRNKRSNLYHHRDWIEKHVYEYLQPTPCGQIEKSRRPEFQNALRSNKKQAATTTSAITTGFDLTEAESLQILNFMPTEPVEIHLMIEELHARMTEKQQDGLLEFIASYRIKEDDGTADAAAAAAENGTKPPAVVVKKEEEHADI
jgi:hypothetical protein